MGGYLKIFLFEIKTDAITNELLDYLEDMDNAKKLAENLCMLHHHHHEKKLKRNPSHTNLKVPSSPNIQTVKGWISVLCLSFICLFFEKIFWLIFQKNRPMIWQNRLYLFRTK